MRSLFTAALLSVPLAGWMTSTGEPVPIDPGGFAFELSTVVPADPVDAFDAFTGDVSPWWDHHHSETPHALRIEPRPGGHFLELFDDEGNGAVHATVNFAKRGEELQFLGPLGFAGGGTNLQMAHRIRFVAEGDGTRVTVSVRGIGEVQEGWPQVVENVWNHFLVDRYARFVSGTLDGTGR